MAEVQVKCVDISVMALHIQGLSGLHWKEGIYLIKKSLAATPSALKTMNPVMSLSKTIWALAVISTAMKCVCQTGMTRAGGHFCYS